MILYLDRQGIRITEIEFPYLAHDSDLHSYKPLFHVMKTHENCHLTCV